MGKRRLKPAEECRNHQFVLRLTRRERAALAELAVQENLPASYLVRKAIRLALEEKARKQSGGLCTGL